MRDDPRPQEIYRHFKGGLYQIMTLAEHAQTGKVLVIYQALYGEYAVYARELSEFLSKTDRQKYPAAAQEYRFEKILVKEKADAMQKPETESADIRIERREEPKEQESGKQAEEIINIDPLVMEFLDADSYEERLNILAALHCRITDEMINTMSVAIDVEINEGDIEERYEALKTCLVTLEKYECNRLR